MYKDITKNSTILTVVSEEASESKETYKIVLRINSDSKWRKVIKDMLEAAAETEEFGIIVRQEFYVNESGSPAFVWSILLWGDLDSASSVLFPILGRRGGPPAPPPSLATSVPTFTATKLERADGTIIKEVPLSPHPGERVLDKTEVINVSDPRRGKRNRAFVEKIG